MEPVFVASWEAGIAPMLEGEIDVEAAFTRAMPPLRDFMEARINPDTLAELAALRPELAPDISMRDTPLSVVIPSFLLSEMERAFQIGFLIFLPFLIIDLVVAAVLMSMGMMMVPPAKCWGHQNERP